MLDALKTLPKDPDEQRKVAELLMSEVKSQACLIEKLQHQLNGQLRHRFGSKSENIEQLQLFMENLETADAAQGRGSAKPAKSEATEKPKRKPLPDHLERIVRCP